jgi:hypothetical protein
LFRAQWALSLAYRNAGGKVTLSGDFQGCFGIGP